MARIRAILMLVLLWPLAGTAAVHEYQIDPVHSRVLFSVTHLGLSRALGTFSAPRGWLRFDPEDPAAARGEFEVDLRTLDLGDPAWNARMARKDSFDSTRHPAARWVVERAEASGANRFNAHGTLHLRGERYPMSLAVEFNGLKRHPLTFRRTIGFSARATLSRSALGFDKWASMVGDAVELQVEAEARRGKRRADGGFDEEGRIDQENEHDVAQ